MHTYFLHPAYFKLDGSTTNSLFALSPFVPTLPFRSGITLAMRTGNVTPFNAAMDENREYFIQASHAVCLR